jgi:P-type Ca2+ transporter type 2C
MTTPSSAILFHTAEIPELASVLETDLLNGLRPEEADNRLKKYGQNKIAVEKSKSPFAIFLGQFLSPIVYLLFGAAGLSFWFEEWLDGTAILIVIIINAVIGFFMEYQADRSMQALKKLSTVSAKALRGKILVEINSEDIVPGDLIFLEAGDLIPADGRVVTSAQLQANESALTGESMPVEKNIYRLAESTPLAERSNMLYKGTFITRGNCYLLVCTTGMQTELGAVAQLVHSSEQSATPLEKKLEQFSKILIKVTVGLVIIILLAGLWNGHGVIAMLETAIALAVAAVPEGLPIVATIALAQGMLKMAQHNVIVKKLSAVETLGGTTVICTDKTGTLTQNKIEVTFIATPSGNWNQKKSDKFVNNENIEHIIKAAILCNTAEMVSSGTVSKEIGDPLEVALLKFASETGVDPYEVRKLYPKLAEEPFDSETKMMATAHAYTTSNVIYIKGAAEEVLKKSASILSSGSTIVLSDTERVKWVAESNRLASEGLRVIAAGFRETENVPDVLSEDIVFAGLIGMVDPSRPEVFAAIEQCKQAGIKIVMITGDHPSTAKNIGLELGIISDEGQEVITGKQMKEYDDLLPNEKKQWINTSVFARVNPKHKLDLVRVFQDNGDVVGMTGDGVNDAPALKKADIGIAMGLRGTQVAQEVADMILKDDSFASISLAIRQGRIIFENIRKFVIFLLSCNMSELAVVSVAAIFNLHFQLFPLQILFINLITDVLPALALGVTEENQNVMRQLPRSSAEPIIDRMRWQAIIVYAIVISTASLSAVFISHYTVHSLELWNRELCNNILFYSLIFSQLFHSFNMGSGSGKFFKSEVVHNKYLWYAFAICVAIIVIVYSILPMRSALSLDALSVTDWLIIIGMSLLSAIVIHLLKRLKIAHQ